MKVHAYRTSVVFFGLLFAACSGGDDTTSGAAASAGSGGGKAGSSGSGPSAGSSGSKAGSAGSTSKAGSGGATSGAGGSQGGKAGATSAGAGGTTAGAGGKATSGAGGTTTAGAGGTTTAGAGGTTTAGAGGTTTAGAGGTTTAGAGGTTTAGAGGDTSAGAGGTTTTAGSGGATTAGAGGDTSAGAGGTTTAGAGGTSGGAGGAASASRDFPDNAWFYDDVTNAPAVANSAQITSWMEGFNGPNGWGTGTMKVDFSIIVVDVPAGTAKRTPTWDANYHYTPDCDEAPIPVPQGGAVERSYDAVNDTYFPTDFSGPFTGYNCQIYDADGDCHMLFRAPSEKRLYEIYHGTIRSNGNFDAGCLAIWDTSVAPPATGRGDQCSSADAAGFPIIPMLFNADEIAAGHIDHAIRLILPNNMIRNDRYVRPATHGTLTTSGPATAPPYGAHFRLRADFPLGTLSPAAQVVAKALQKYGMYVADGGQIALTAESDVLTTHKWADVGFQASSLQSLKASDFAIIDHGADITVTYDCTRTLLTQ